MRLGAEGEVTGEVKVVERLGGETFLYTQLEDGAMVIVQTDGEIPTGVHERVAIKLDPSTCHLFDAEGLVGRAPPPPPLWRTCAGCRRARRAERSGAGHGLAGVSTPSSSAAEAPAASSPAASSPSMTPASC